VEFEACGKGLLNRGFVQQQHGLSSRRWIKQQTTGCADFAHLQSSPAGIREKHGIVGCQHHWYFTTGLHLCGGSTRPSSHLSKQLHNAGGPCGL
jgi:hypothetical protein